MTNGSLGVMYRGGWGQPGRQLPWIGGRSRTLWNHWLDTLLCVAWLLSLQRTGNYRISTGRGRAIRGFQSRWQVHESLDLDSITGAHMGNMIEIGRRRDHFGTSIRISEKIQMILIFWTKKRTKRVIKNVLYFWGIHVCCLMSAEFVGLFSVCNFRISVYYTKANSKKSSMNKVKKVQINF